MTSRFARVTATYTRRSSSCASCGLAVGDEGLVLLRREPDEHRQRLGVAAHRVGHRVRGRGPARDAAQRREDLGGQRRQHHHRPLEALRPVHGHELHGIGRRRPVELGHLVEPRGHREPREERADRGVALGVGEARDEVDEGGEPLRPVQEQQLGRRGHLDVETGHRDDAVHEVGQRVADAAAQQPDLRRERGRTGAAPRGRSRACRGRRGRRAATRRRPGRRRATAASSWSAMSASSRRPRPPARYAARSPSSARSRSPTRQRGPVSSRTSDGLAVESCSTSSTATTSATSGIASMPSTPTHLDGQPAVGQRRARAPGSRTWHGTAPRSRPDGVPASTCSRTRSPTHAISSAYVEVSATRMPPGSLPPGETSGATCGCSARSGAARSLAASRIRCARAAVLGEGAHRGQAAVDAGEVLGEAVDVGHARARASRRWPAAGRRRR